MAWVVLVACVVGGCSVAADRKAGPVVPAPPAPGALRGALIGLDGSSGLGAVPGSAERKALIRAADRALRVRPHPRKVLVITETDDPFVTDSQAAWTLALAGRVTGDARFSRASERVIDAWVAHTERIGRSCPDSGHCSSSLMVSRAAPALVFAVDVLVAADAFDQNQLDRFHSWLRTVVVPAASDRDNNWGDAGTLLRAVAFAELGDLQGLAVTAARWRERIDLVKADGQIPEEIRRDDASLMYSQDALDSKMLAADVLGRAGINVWSYQGSRGGTLEGALRLVAAGLRHPAGWPGGSGHLRQPNPSGVWSIAARHWPDASFDGLARAAVGTDGTGHSAVIWTGFTHPVAS